MFSKIFVTVFYIGKIKYCPGTWGSLIAFPICYIIMHYTITNQIIFTFSNFSTKESQLLTLLIIELSACLILFIIGTYCTNIYLKTSLKKDPSEVIIDEVVGQMLTIILCFFSLVFINQSLNYFFVFFLLPFGLFRFFDIIKPWPIDWVDKNINGALGVMLDDILAAIFASVVHYAIIFTLIDYLQ